MYEELICLDSIRVLNNRVIYLQFTGRVPSVPTIYYLDLKPKTNKRQIRSRRRTSENLTKRFDCTTFISENIFCRIIRCSDPKGDPKSIETYTTFLCGVG